MSTGNVEAVAPYSGAMFESVARSAIESADRPSPQNSTNLPTTPCLRSISVSVSTRSVAVTPIRSAPRNSTPITIGVGSTSGSPSITASASIPPTPQPRIPSASIMVVCESVPTSVSGKATPSRTCTTRPRCSRFTWCTIPIPGGTTRKPSNAPCAHRSSAYRSPLRSYSRSMLRAYANREPNASTCTEWSITRSAGTSGSTPDGAFPARAIALRIAARSTTAGTPVKSCRITRAGRNATDAVSGAGAGQLASARTSSVVTWIDPALRSAISSRTRSVYGRRAVSAMPASSSRPRRK